MKQMYSFPWPRILLLGWMGGFLFLAGNETLQAGLGLTTRFADVVLENVKVGRLYNLRTENKVPYTLKNQGDISTKVVIEVLIPSQAELMPGYEAIPDPSWVKVVPGELHLDARGTGFAEVLLQVPDDPQYAGRHFQAGVWAHTAGEGFIGVGVKSRLRFSTGLGPETLKEEKRRKAMLTMDFDMVPQKLFLNAVEPGAVYDVKAKQDKSIKITNRAEDAIHLAVQSAPWDPRFSLPEGYEAAPDPAWLKVDPSDVVVEGLQVKALKLFLNVPPGHQGKKYAFLVKAQLQLGVDVEIFSRVFVTVK